jgi:serine protease
MKISHATYRWLPVLMTLLLGAWLPSQAELGPRPLGQQRLSAHAGRVIVTFKSGLSDFRRSAQSSGQALSTVMSKAEAAQALELRAQRLGGRLGLALHAGRAVDERRQVVTAYGLDSRTLAEQLAGDSEVERAVVDWPRRAMKVPNDTYYAQGPVIVGSNGGPEVGQWYLRVPDSNALTAGDDSQVVSSINAPAAWDVTIGHGSVIVAVLDTGIRPEHPDFARKLVAGYDMIGAGTNDPSSVVQTANDGNLADADPSDPGDWVTDSEVNDSSSPFYHCTEPDSNGKYSGENSSWHGTQTAGLIGATTNNGVGIAGVGWNVKVQAVRVLGKCGGYDSDIIAGMRWAAGGTIPGIPVNATPAKVLNMSLGTGGDVVPCSETEYPAAIADLADPNKNYSHPVIVVSAGNGNGHAVNSPANCAGVVAVAGVRHTGTKVGFSDIGPEVAIAAPAGNCVNTTTGSPCLYPIMTTTNAGTTTPGASIYSNAFNSSLGTSFSAPLVSGTAALMMTANPSLTANQVKAALQASARPFPQSGAQPDVTTGLPVPMCHAPNSTDQGQCYCTTSTCGAGLLDAGAAVASVAQLHAYINVKTTAPTAGSPISLSSDTVVLPPNHTLSSLVWSLTNDGGIVPALTDTGSPSITVTPTAGGQFTVQLTVVDSTGASSTTSQTVQVAAASGGSTGGGGSSGGGSSGGGSGGGSSGGGAMSWAWLAALAAATLALRRGRRA